MSSFDSPPTLSISSLLFASVVFSRGEAFRQFIRPAVARGSIMYVCMLKIRGLKISGFFFSFFLFPHSLRSSFFVVCLLPRHGRLKLPVACANTRARSLLIINRTHLPHRPQIVMLQACLCVCAKKRKRQRSRESKTQFNMELRLAHATSRANATRDRSFEKIGLHIPISLSLFRFPFTLMHPLLPGAIRRGFFNDPLFRWVSSLSSTFSHTYTQTRHRQFLPLC